MIGRNEVINEVYQVKNKPILTWFNKLIIVDVNVKAEVFHKIMHTRYREHQDYFLSTSHVK